MKQNSLFLFSLCLLILFPLTPHFTWARPIEDLYPDFQLPPSIESSSSLPAVPQENSFSTQILSLLQPLDLNPEEIDSIISLAENLLDSLSTSKSTQQEEELDLPERLILNFLQISLDVGISSYSMLSFLLEGLNTVSSTKGDLRASLERTGKALQQFQDVIPAEVLTECISVIIKYDPGLTFLLDNSELVAEVLGDQGEGYIRGLIQSFETLSLSSEEISSILTGLLPFLYREGITASSEIVSFVQGLKETLEEHDFALKRDLIDSVIQFIEAVEGPQNLSPVVDALSQIFQIMDNLLDFSSKREEIFLSMINLSTEIYKQEQDINLTIQSLHNQIEYLLNTFPLLSSSQLNLFLKIFSEMIKSGVSPQSCIDYINRSLSFFQYLTSLEGFTLADSTPLSQFANAIRIFRRLGMDFEQQWENIYSPLYDMMQTVEKEAEKFLISRNYLTFIKKTILLEEGESLESIFDLLSNALKLRIFWPQRFDYETLEYIVTNRLETAQAYERNESPSYTGPLCIFLTAPRDWNGALENIDELLDDFRTHGYQVLYYEPWNLADLLYAFAETTRPEEGIKASVVLFGGHGAPTHVDRYLNTAFVESLREFGIGECLTDRGVIILNSCSTGAGGPYSDNIANALQELFPQAGHIFAPISPAGLSHINFDPLSNDVSSVRYSVPTYDAISRIIHDETP